MNFSNAYALLCDNVYTVQVRFYRDTGANASKEYDYLCDIPDINPGDDVIVLAPDFDTGTGTIPKVCKVVSVDTDITVDLMSTKAYKWIVCKIDYTEHNERQKAAAALSKKLTATKHQKMRTQVLNTMLNELELTIDELKAIK